MIIGAIFIAEGRLANALARIALPRDSSNAWSKVIPRNTNWQRELSVSHNKVGSVLQAQGTTARPLR